MQGYLARRGAVRTACGVCVYGPFARCAQVSFKAAANKHVLPVACRAAKTTPAPAASSSTGQPQPPIGALTAEVTRDKVKAALIRLANNDAFVNLLAQELRTVGLLQYQ